MKRVLVAIDSMKGCLTSTEASEAMACGIRQSHPDATVTTLAVADGGEGTAECIAGYREGYREMKSVVTGPEGIQIRASWWLNEGMGCACIDMAAAAGLPLLAPAHRNPMLTTTYGVGELLEEARKNGARRIILGLGGSATVDGGMGALQALGVRLTDIAGDVISVPFTGRMLPYVGKIDANGINEIWKSIELTLACDVTTRFTGENGAARIFAPQKGATEEDTLRLDSGLLNIRNIILRDTGIDLDGIDGSGAAGGCGGGLAAILGAEIESGSDLVLDAAGFDALIEDADIIVTGEGKADRQTLMNKLPGTVLRRSRLHRKPVIIVGGIIADKDLLENAGFTEIIDINSPDIEKASGTSGGDPLDREIALRRLEATGQMLTFQ